MPNLVMSGVDKRYGGVQALRGASLTLQPGEVHGLLGPNGSGKSTLNKVLAGTVAADRSNVELDGKVLTINSPMDAYRHGIAAVYQQLSLVPQLTVAQNLALGIEDARLGFLRKKTVSKAVRSVLERFSSGLSPRVTELTLVSSLTPGEQQIIEVAKAVLRRPRILVLDEATASLHRDQVKLVFEVVRELCSEGVSVVFVSHRLDEITELCTRATILRSGETVTTVSLKGTSESELVRLMVGDISDASSKRTELDADAPVLLDVVDLSGPRIHGVTLSARSGEVVGLGGLQGQGQSELLLTLFGALRARGGTVMTSGQKRRLKHPHDASRAGLALVPGDRATQGMFAQRPILENLAIVSLARRLVFGFGILKGRERAAAADMVKRLHIKIGRLDDPVSSLSGGNQQKVIIAKWLLDEPNIVLLDDPTKGVDISAKAEIYALIHQLTQSGATVIFNSSDDRELAKVADRVLVMFEGQIRGELLGGDVTYDNLVASALLIGIGEQSDDKESTSDDLRTEGTHNEDS